MFTARGRHAAFFTLILGIFSALTPLAAFAAGTVTLAWDASLGTNVIANYKVYYGVASRTYTNSVSAGTALTASVSNLVQGATYYFAATATDTSGLESDYSTEVSTIIAAPNQPPTLAALANVTMNEDASTQIVNLSGITDGSTNETQALTVTASSSNPGLIPTPSVSYTSPNTTGSISFAPVADMSGSAIITVTVNDGAASNNIYSRTFTATVNAVNDVPTLTRPPDIAISEGAGQQVVNLSGIGSGAANESQTLIVTASSSNTGLIPNPTVSYTSPNATGSLAFTPLPYANGSATITVAVNDGGTGNNVISRTFTVTVNGVNNAPTLTALPDLTISEGAAQQTINLSGISSGATNESQTLVVTAASSDTSLIPNPAVTYTSPNATGSIRFTPAAYANGSATITVTVNDGGAGNNLVSRTFLVTVAPVNNAPTLNTPANVTLNEGAGQQTVNLAGIGSGAANENDTLSVTASSSNPTLIPTPTVSYTSPNSSGSLTFTPSPYENGSAIITVTVNDGAAASNTVSRTFTVTVNAVNQAPTLDVLANLTINQNAGQQTVNLAGIGTGAANESQTLTVTASSGNTGVIPTPAVTYTSPGATGSIRFTPVTNAYGTATIAVTVNDGGASNNVFSRTFTVTVNQINGPPSISSITDRIIAVDTATPAIPFTISDAETPVASLTVSGSSDNTGLVPNTGIVLGGSGGNRTVTVTPAAGQMGIANITITVNDGTYSASTAFQLSVRQRPGAPGVLRIVSVGP